MTSTEIVNTVVPMTTYEKLAIILSIVAIVIPIIQWIWKKWINKPILKFYPNGNIRLFFNQSGSYIQIDGVFEAVNKAITIKKLRVEIVRKRDQRKLNLTWSSFIPPTMQSIAGNPLMTNETAHPFRIEADSVMCAFTQYADLFNSYGKKFQSKSKDIFNSIPEIQKDSETYQSALSKYKANTLFSSIKTIVENEFYWEIGEYELTVISNYRDKEAKFAFAFSVEEQDYLKISQNIEESIISNLKDRYLEPRNYQVVDIALTDLSK